MILKILLLDEEDTSKISTVDVPTTDNVAIGVVVPMPIRPLAKTFNMFEVWAEEISNMEEMAPVDDANTDNEPLDIIPPAPTISPVPAIMFPWANISFRDWMFPTSALWAIRLVTSVPEMSTTEIESEPELAT